MRSILVTGGAGFIGSHTCLLLLEKGYSIFILDSFFNSSETVIDKISLILKKKKICFEDKIQYFRGDIRNKEDIDKISIEAIRFKDLVDKYKINQIDKLLVDVEGSEFAILNDIDLSSINIKKIIFEYKHFDGYQTTGKKLEEILKKFEENGYTTKKIDEENILATKS